MRETQPSETLHPLLSAELRSMLRWVDQSEDNSAWAQWRTLESIVGPMLVVNKPNTVSIPGHLPQEMAATVLPLAMSEAEKGAATPLPMARAS
ncbi:MAG: hypothetical protein HQL64_00845 [Magnetococcales bacterium]|nr:hypothetical protein [Magnetococcales bacterium]